MSDYLLYLIPHEHADDFGARFTKRIAFETTATTATDALAAARQQYPRETHLLRGFLVRSAGNPTRLDVLNCYADVAQPYRWYSQAWLTDPESNLAIGADFAPEPDNYLLDTGRLAHRLRTRQDLGLHLFGPLTEAEDHVALAHDAAYFKPTVATPAPYISHRLHDLAEAANNCETRIENFSRFVYEIETAAREDPSLQLGAIADLIGYVLEHRDEFDSETTAWFEQQFADLVDVALDALAIA